MMRFILIGSMFCPPVSLETTDILNQKDATIYTNLKEECGRRDYLNTCLKTFKKVDETTYSVLCQQPKQN